VAVAGALIKLNSEELCNFCACLILLGYKMKENEMYGTRSTHEEKTVTRKSEGKRLCYGLL
jgi:hypothetical protein